MKRLVNLKDHRPPELVYRHAIADTSKAGPHLNPARIYVAIATSGSARTASPPKEFADPGITLDAASAVPSPKVSAVEEDFDVFETITYRKNTNTGARAVITVRHHRQPVSGVQNSAFSPIISKKDRF
jgi:hypothetical protein